MSASGIQVSKHNIATCVFLLFLILVTFLPRVSSLSRHWSADEHLWMQRSRDFFFALESGRFEDTFTAYHPGVTTCWLGSLGIWYTFERYDFFKGWFRSDQFFSPDMLARVRFPIAVITGVLILIIGMLLLRLFGHLVAGMGTLFLCVEPFLLSESRRAHTDVLTALFLFLALLFWLCYLEGKTRTPRRDIVFSGICFGLACLTKSHAGAFLLFLPILLFWYRYQRRICWRHLLVNGLLWITVTSLTVLIVWPYLWTVTFKGVPLWPLLFFGNATLLVWSWRKHLASVPFLSSRTTLFLLGGNLVLISIFSLYAADRVIDRMYAALTNAHVLPTLFLGEIRYDPGLLYFPVMWFVWTGLLTIPLIVFLMYHVWWKRQKTRDVYRIVVALMLFVLFYFVGLSCVSKKISRYLVIFLPALSLLTAIGAVRFAQLWKRRWLCYLILSIFFVLQAIPILRLHPNYRSYYHPLLMGKWVEENTSSITGAGLDLTADYLNAKPNAKQLQVRTTWSSRNFGRYFDGNTFVRDSDRVASYRNVDYDIEYLHDKQVNGTPIDAPASHRRNANLRQNDELPRVLEHIIELNGINYVWIYRVLYASSEGAHVGIQ